MRSTALARQTGAPMPDDALRLTLDRAPTSSRASSTTPQARRLLSRSASLSCRGTPPTAGSSRRAQEIWASQLAASKPWSRRSPEQRRAVGGLRHRPTKAGDHPCSGHRRSGALLGPAIVWQVRRTAGLCADWKRNGLEPLVRGRHRPVAGSLFQRQQDRCAAARASRRRRPLAAAGEACFGIGQQLAARGASPAARCNATETASNA